MDEDLDRAAFVKSMTAVFDKIDGLGLVERINYEHILTMFPRIAKRHHDLLVKHNKLKQRVTRLESKLSKRNT